jgi:hypothetical protein
MVFAGFWMRTGRSGEMWIIEASRKSRKSFYEGKKTFPIKERPSG